MCFGEILETVFHGKLVTSDYFSVIASLLCYTSQVFKAFGLIKCLREPGLDHNGLISTE